MQKIIVEPVPVHIQNQLERYLRTNDYRFVFYAYGTNDYGPPHYALYTAHWNTMAALYLSEYILYTAH